MASGYGLSGGPSRCFPFWQEVLACYVVNTNADSDAGKVKCIPVLEDYYECLHHRKEAVKMQHLQTAYRRREAMTERDKGPTAGEVRSLGLLQASDPEKNVSRSSILPSYKDNLPRGTS